MFLLMHLLGELVQRMVQRKKYFFNVYGIFPNGGNKKWCGTGVFSALWVQTACVNPSGVSGDIGGRNER